MIALGLLLLVAAVVVALVGVLANTGSGHALNSDFNLFGYHLQGSTGQLLLIGVIVGAVGMLGLNMLLAGIGRGFSRRVSSRRELKQTRREAHSLHEERNTLAQQLEQERIARARTEAEQAAARGPAGNAGSVTYPVDAGAVPPGAVQPGALPPAAVQPGAAQPGLVQPGAAHSGPAQPGLVPPGAARSGPAQPAPAQPGPAQPRPTQSGPAQPGPAQPGPAQPRPTQSGPSQPEAEPGARPGAFRRFMKG